MDMQNVSNLQISEGGVKTIHDRNGHLLWGGVGYDTKYAGDTTQVTYTGKNLASPESVFVKNNPYSDMVFSKSVFIPAGTYSASISNIADATNWRFAFKFFYTDGTNVLDAITQGVVTFSINSMGDTYSNDTACVQRNNSTLTSLYFTTTVDTYVVFGIMGGDVSNITTLNYQLEVGETASTYEPYTGGIPSPNPGYPQPVNVVTGEQTVRIIGKNYLNLVGVTSNGVTGTMNSDGSFTLTGEATATGGFRFGRNENPYLPAGTYTFTIGEARGSNVALVINDGNENITVRITPGNTSATVTIASAAIGIGLFIGVTNGVTYNETFKLQLTAGSAPDYDFESYQSQSYTVNLGSIELCRIGTYQDYIYKSGDDWYVHKAINKVILNGSEAWSMYSGRDGTFYITKNDIMPASSISATPDVISDYYEPRPFASLYNMIVDYGVANHNAQRWVAIRNKDYSDVSSFKTWLASNNTTVYYVLATPANTKITDNTLIDQLNAVHQWATRYGYNTTVSGDLPIVLRRDSLQ